MIPNLRSTDVRPNCLECNYFQSFESYYEDPEEDNDCGFCNSEPGLEDVVGDMKICDRFEEVEE